MIIATSVFQRVVQNICLSISSCKYGGKTFENMCRHVHCARYKSVARNKRCRYVEAYVHYLFVFVFKQVDFHFIDEHKFCNLDTGTPRKSCARGDWGGHME